MSNVFLIGVTGGSGSGKTYFLNKLMDALGRDKVTLVSQDNYYRPRADQPHDENGVSNFDTPESIDYESFTRDILALKVGNVVTRKEYTFNNPSIEPQTLVFQPTCVILIEGIFVLHYPEISRMIDLKLFIDAQDHIKIKRRILRDKLERGYDIEDVLYRYENHVMPSYEKYIKVHKRDADLIICNDFSFMKALDVLVVYIQHKLKR
jgi:uridine kinase